MSSLGWVVTEWVGLLRHGDAVPVARLDTARFFLLSLFLPEAGLDCRQPMLYMTFVLFSVSAKENKEPEAACCLQQVQRVVVAIYAGIMGVGFVT